MSTRSGITLNGKHFRETFNVAGRTQFFIDGKPVSKKVYVLEMINARRADADAQRSA